MADHLARLDGTATHENLRAAFAAESQAAGRYLWFAQQADIEGRPGIAALFRSVAEGETGHAHGHLEYLATVGDPSSGELVGVTEQNLRAALATELHESGQLYPDFAATARDEGFGEIAEWFETVARAEQALADRLARALDEL